MPQALRKGDTLRGSASEHGGHYDDEGDPIHPRVTVTGYVKQGSGNVFINGQPAARLNDKTAEFDSCNNGTGTITSGSGTVFINGKPAATKSSSYRQHSGSGKFTSGSGNVIIG